MIKNRCSPVSLVLFIAIGVFLIGTAGAQAQGESDGCVAEVLGKKANCTANDIRLTELVGGLDISDACTGNTCSGGANDGDSCGNSADCPGGACIFDTMTFTTTGRFESGPSRYDVGIYIATDDDANGDLAQTGTCTRFRFAANAVNLDFDECGDVNAASTQDVFFGPVTVKCVDNDNNGSIDIAGCQTWGNAIDEIPGGKQDCDSDADVRAGTPSKCNCDLLPICVAVTDTNVCDTEVCRFTCSATDTAACDPTSASACNSTPANCTERVVHVPLDNGTSCGAGGDQCNDPFECQEGVCVPGGPKEDGTDCEAPPTDTVPPGACDAQDECLAGVCVEKVKDAGTLCRAAGNECDAREDCDGSSPLCPADICDTTGTRPAVHFCSNST